MLVLDVGLVTTGWTPADGSETLYYWLSVIAFAASGFFRFKANEMAIDHALLHGGEFADKRKEGFDQACGAGASR